MSGSACLIKKIQYYLLLVFCLLCQNGMARDLDTIREEGVIRHLGVPYANFVTGLGDGLDVELVQGFASYLGVRYEYVESTWLEVIDGLTSGQVGESAKGHQEDGRAIQYSGDVIASGMTIFEWRKRLVGFSEPIFPSGVWLVARADSKLIPIVPGPDIEHDIQVVRSMLSGVSVLGFSKTCLDPELYDLDKTGADVRIMPADRKLSEMVPAILRGDAETTLLDIPDALIALDRWQGEIKVIGPLSANQYMAAAFRPSSTKLRKAFNEYLLQSRQNGRYSQLVRKYYPGVFRYFKSFFSPALKE